MDSCEHLEKIPKPFASPASAACEKCLAAGQRWVELRACLTCGHVGCCDSTPGKHATAHFHETGHAVMQSCEPGATWGWCYVHEKKLGPFPPLALV